MNHYHCFNIIIPSFSGTICRPCRSCSFLSIPMNWDSVGFVWFSWVPMIWWLWPFPPKAVIPGSGGLAFATVRACGGMRRLWGSESVDQMVWIFRNWIHPNPSSISRIVIDIEWHRYHILVESPNSEFTIIKLFHVLFDRVDIVWLPRCKFM